MAMKAKIYLPFAVSAAVIIAALTISLLFVFGEGFTLGEGFALWFYFAEPFVWLAIAAYNLMWRQAAISRSMQNERPPIPLWSILLCAALPVVEICGWGLSALGTVVNLQWLTGAVFDLNVRRVFVVLQSILCLVYLALLAYGFVRSSADLNRNDV